MHPTHRRSAAPLLALLLALAMLALSACDNGDIHALAQQSDGCPRPEAYSLAFGPGPTVTGDGSLAYGASSVVIFNRPFAGTVQANLCTDITLGAASFFAAGMGALGGEGLALVVSWFAAEQISVTFDHNLAGSSCPGQIFNNPAYVPGGQVHLRAALDQTGAVPVMRAWVDADPAGPPQLDSSTPWCSTISSGWTFTPGTEAYAQGSDVTVNRYGFQP